MEFELVPAAGIRQSSDAQAKVELRKPDAMKSFFDGGQISFAQYPIARTLSEFMIRQNKRGYVDFINGIKDGLSWQESLEQKYGAQVGKLIPAYGASMGVQGLKP